MLGGALKIESGVCLLFNFAETSGFSGDFLEDIPTISSCVCVCVFA